ncbi:MAG: glycosyltransferase [Gemmatimonadaceae bacterium]|nr:glycosyltransferase [Gemmatimonadaceae bacterium]
MSRILHVLNDLDVGGVQTWLRQALPLAHQRGWQLDVAVTMRGRGDLAPEFAREGARIFECPGPSRPFEFLHTLTDVLRREGPFEVVHSHFDPVALPLIAARRADVPVRVAHSHRGCRELRTMPGPVRRLAAPFLQRLIDRHATLKVACSDTAAVAVFGKDAEASGQVHRFRLGLDLDRLSDSGSRYPAGMTTGSPTILHVGRLSHEKNHRFLLRIFGEIRARWPGARLWIVGDGPMAGLLQATVDSMGLAGAVEFLGVRQDLGVIYRAADVFVMPSRVEGLPLAAIEAQATGLPCVFSSTITREVTICRDLVRWLDLETPADAWADAVLGMLGRPRRDRRAQVVEAGFGMVSSMAALARIYRTAAGRGRASA